MKVYSYLCELIYLFNIDESTPELLVWCARGTNKVRVADPQKAGHYTDFDGVQLLEKHDRSINTLYKSF